MTNQYVRGRTAEYKTRDYLKGQGYEYCIRSAGSHGPIDLLVSNGYGTILAIQVKRGRSPFTLPDSRMLRSYAGAFKAHPILASVLKIHGMLKIGLEYIKPLNVQESRKIQMMCVKSSEA